MDKNELIEQIEFELMQRLSHIYDQKIDEQAVKIEELEEQL